MILYNPVTQLVTMYLVNYLVADAGAFLDCTRIIFVHGIFYISTLDVMISVHVLLRQKASNIKKHCTHM